MSGISNIEHSDGYLTCRVEGSVGPFLAAVADAAVVDLLDQLERVLVEVAASPSDRSGSELDEVRRRIESGSLLFKVRVVSSDLQERRNAAVRQTGQRSSL